MKNAAALKQELAMLGAITEVGFRAGAREAGRIHRLAAELEAMNPCAEPALATGQLRGHWKLLYSNLGFGRTTTLSSLSFGILPPVAVEVAELFNQVDPATALWDNVITYTEAETGEPGTAITLGTYAVTDDGALDLRFAAALVAGAGRQVRLPVEAERVPPLTVRITYLDEAFRIVRGEGRHLYLFERLDAAPLRWAREG